jgi:hypothetical protein
MQLKISAPCLITPRLLPGVKIGNSWLSIEYGEWSHDNRKIYLIYIDTPEGEYVTNIQSGVGGGSLQQGLESCLSFMGACAESMRYAGEEGENSDLFCPEVAQWCLDNSDEIDMLQCELLETTNLIEEE